MSVNRYSVWEDEMFEEKHALNSTNGMVHLMVKHEEYAALEARYAALAAENAESEKRMQQLIQVINNADNDYCMCGDEMKNRVHGGCGHPTGMFDYHYNQWLKSANETPSTDAFLAELRASAVDEVCLKISNAIVNCYQDEQIGLDAAATICGNFASEIRKGVQS